MGRTLGRPDIDIWYWRYCCFFINCSNYNRLAIIKSRGIDRGWTHQHLYFYSFSMKMYLKWFLARSQSVRWSYERSQYIGRLHTLVVAYIYYHGSQVAMLIRITRLFIIFFMNLGVLPAIHVNIHHKRCFTSRRVTQTPALMTLLCVVSVDLVLDLFDFQISVMLAPTLSDASYSYDSTSSLNLWYFQYIFEIL